MTVPDVDLELEAPRRSALPKFCRTCGAERPQDCGCPLELWLEEEDERGLPLHAFRVTLVTGKLGQPEPALLAHAVAFYRARRITQRRPIARGARLVAIHSQGDGRLREDLPLRQQGVRDGDRITFREV